MDGDHPRDADYPQDSYHTRIILFTSSLIRMDTFLQAFYGLKLTQTERPYVLGGCASKKLYLIKSLPSKFKINLVLGLKLDNIQ